MNRNTDKSPHRYDDMLDLPHHLSSTRPHMSISNRAAQFSPFAALTGYEDEIRETGRLTGEEMELSDSEKERLDEKLRNIMEHLEQRPAVSITYFVSGARKAGGSYVTDTGIIKRIDPIGQKVIFYAENKMSDGRSIPMDDIVEIDCEQFCEGNNITETP